MKTIDMKSLMKLWKMLSDRGVDATDDIAQLVEQDAEAWREGELTKGVSMQKEDTTPSAPVAETPATETVLPEAVAAEVITKSEFSALVDQVAAIAEQIKHLGETVEQIKSTSESTGTALGEIRGEITGAVNKAQQAVETADAAVQDARRQAGRPVTPAMATIVEGAKGADPLAELFQGSSVFN